MPIMRIVTVESPIPDAAAAAGPKPVPALIIRPPSGWVAINFREVWLFRDLLWTLAGRDLKVRYKQTALGVVWVVLQPVIAAIIFAMVFGVIAKMPSEGGHYFLFAFTGLLGWNLFSNVLSRSSACLVGNVNLISKVFFPRLVLPLSTVGSALVDYAVSLGMLVIFMFVYRVAPGWRLLLLPVWTLVLLMLSLGIGLFAAALTVSYRDVQYVLPVAMNILMYASPVAYSATNVPKSIGLYYNLNPLAGVMEAYRWSVLGRTAPQVWAVAYSCLFGVVILWIGAVAFKQMERQFADII